MSKLGQVEKRSQKGTHCTALSIKHSRSGLITETGGRPVAGGERRGEGNAEAGRDMVWLQKGDKDPLCAKKGDRRWTLEPARH